ncbi:MAG: hypothetical protein M0Z33_05555 [Actinomycetota bacterium]|nr:hypothetical protein [Actinomycetota bacterium]
MTPVLPGAVRAVLCASAGGEPVELRARLEKSARDDPRLGSERAEAELAAELASRWRVDLERAGVAASLLPPVVRAARHEVWLWVMGERTWRHTVEALAGRVDRRCPG